MRTRMAARGERRVHPAGRRRHAVAHGRRAAADRRPDRPHSRRRSARTRHELACHRGYPAEYGRKLGGVIEGRTEPGGRQGVHGGVSLTAGSFEAPAKGKAALAMPRAGSLQVRAARRRRNATSIRRSRRITPTRAQMPPVRALRTGPERSRPLRSIFAPRPIRFRSAERARAAGGRAKAGPQQRRDAGPVSYQHIFSSAGGGRCARG